MKLRNNNNGKDVELSSIFSLICSKYIDIPHDSPPPDVDVRKIAMGFTDLFCSRPDEEFAHSLIKIQVDSVLFMAQLVYLGMRLQSAITSNNLTLLEENESTNDRPDSDSDTDGI